MLTQDVRIHYIGFHPAEKTEQRLQTWADELHEEAPSESCMKVVYSKHGRDYQGEIRITSRAGEFYAIASGINLYSVARDVTKRMRRQLQKWKTVRFHRHGNIGQAEETIPPRSSLN
ncbi:MAG: hypothetical protein KF802_12720 [Bdellovibrionaceae bacterium]|nr:hypothetical protein [Pseudobdellovibrionaceae bacterium]MBX3034835.1 hypothetical protein [Pseudobdellovibrionaceae bacterium]